MSSAPNNMLTDEECLENSSFLSNLQRKGKLAPSRLRTLYESAKSSKPPREPDPWECCGSSCKPCVKELWRQELKCWIECHPDGSPDKEDEYEEKSAAHDSGEGEEQIDEGASSKTVENTPQDDTEAGNQSNKNCLTFEKERSEGESEVELVQTIAMLSV